jgi:phospho-N-acetylmuramoyl-pentapeptide-transferase
VSALAYGVLGFLDDYLKIKTHKNLGLRAYQKIIGQGGIALLVSVFYYIYNRAGTVVVPFANVTIDLGFWILPFTFLLFIATTNAVNLTDGLDGLAGGVTAVCLAAFSLLAVLVSKSVVRVDELQAILNVVAVAIGALLCYLLFNSNRATVFMGDTGSLFLGGFVAAVSLFCYMPLFVLVLGAMYVLSALSVIIQVAYFKFSGGKRVFLMAPFHHHLEKHGWGEARIVALYCIVTAVVAAVCVVCLI